MKIYLGYPIPYDRKIKIKSLKIIFESSHSKKRILSTFYPQSRGVARRGGQYVLVLSTGYTSPPSPAPRAAAHIICLWATPDPPRKYTVLFVKVLCCTSHKYYWQIIKDVLIYQGGSGAYLTCLDGRDLHSPPSHPTKYSIDWQIVLWLASHYTHIYIVPLCDVCTVIICQGMLKYQGGWGAALGSYCWASHTSGSWSCSTLK